MISGRVSGALLSLVLTLPAAAAQVYDIDTLLAALARKPPQSIGFTEIHSSALLERELVVRGTLDYAGFGKLSRIVTEPYAERTEIDGDSVRIFRTDRPERRFSLKRAPELGGLLTGFSAILGGERATLEREFELALANGAVGWQLTLKPRGTRAQARIMAIRVRGAGDTPACIVTVAKNGGATTELLLGNAAAAADIAEQRTTHCAALP
jgi:outer membrane lipoprotein carrier protein LolA